MVLIAFGAGAATATDGQWHKPELADCTGKNGGAKQQCDQTNHCLSSVTDSCDAHVGTRKTEEGGQFLLAKCFEERMLECMRAVRPGDNAASTNPTDNPSAWDCIMSDGSRASNTRCRNVNYCFDSGARACSEKIGARKYTPQGQHEMMGCNQEKQIACLRAID